MVEDEFTYAGGAGVVHFHGCDGGGVVREEVVVGDGGVAGQERDCGEFEVD